MDAPASPRGKEYITLHLYRLSGEFIIADRVELDQCVERYVQDLEEGCIEPSIRIENTRGDYPWLGYELVWRDMVLDCGKRFVEYVEGHGMPVDEPVEITVVKHGSRSHYC